MKAFAYVNATNEKEAIAALAKAERGRMLPMAGGMDLLGMMKDYIVSPERVVSIRNATSVTLRHIPITPDKLLTELERAGGTN